MLTSSGIEIPSSPPPYIVELIKKCPELARVNADAIAGIECIKKPAIPLSPTNSALLLAAQDYVSRGYSVIPLRRDKKPAVPWKEFQKRRATEEELHRWFTVGNYNIGIVTGELSGISVVDFDTLDAIELAKKKNFPITPNVKTSRGFHAYFRYEQGHRNSQKRADLLGIDFRGEGGCVAAPPSQHETGAVYHWVEGKGLDDVPLADVPEWILAVKQEDQTPIKDVFKGAAEGGRNEALARVAGSVIGKGESYDEALQFCLTWNERNIPPLPENEVETTVRSIWQKHQRSVESVDSREWPQPLPLPEKLPPVKALEPDMIPDPLRGWLMDISDRMQIPPDFSTAAAVVALGSIIGRGCGIHPKRHDDWLVVPNLWGAVVGRPSLMKTPAVSEAQRHLIRLETEAREEYQEAARAYELDNEVAKLTKSAIGEEIKKAVKKGQDIEEARARLAALANEEPKRQRFQTQDATVEKIGELLNENPRGLLVNRDELIGWFRSLDKDGRENDRSFYLEAWNGNRGYTYDRIGRGTLDIQATCLSIFGAITPGPLSSYVYQANRGGNGDDGLLQRFQVIVWPDAPNEWKNVDRFPDTKEKGRAWEIFQALSGDIPGALKEEGADIPALRFSPGGQGIFDEWRHDIETRLTSNHGLPPALESHLAKYRSLMPSLALIFHLVDVVNGSNTGAVSEVSAVMAVRWCEYLESHAGRIYGAATVPGMESAREIIKHIHRGAIQNGDKVRDIWRHQWLKLTTSDEVKAGLNTLQEYDWLTIEKNETGGRPSETIRLNSHIKP